MKYIGTTASEVSHNGTVVIDKDTDGNHASTEIALDIDFDREIATSGTENHIDYGIDLDVTSASLGSSSLYGMHVDVSGTSDGTVRAYGIQLDVSGAASNTGIAINTTGTHLRLEANADPTTDYATLAVADTGDLTIQSYGDGTLDSDINIVADGKISLQAAGHSGVLIDHNRSGNEDGSGTGLHIDFDRTVPTGISTAHNDRGINLDVTSASLGTSSLYGMDIDVVGATSGSSTAYGIDMSVTGADINYGMFIKSSHTQLRLIYDDQNYVQHLVEDDGSLTIRTYGDGTTDSDLTLRADGKISLKAAAITGDAVHIDADGAAGSIVNVDAGILDVDVTGAATITAGGALKLEGAAGANGRLQGVVGGTGIPMGLQHYHFRGYCLGLASHNWQYPEDFGDPQSTMGGGQLNTDYGNQVIGSGSLTDVSEWFRHSTYVVGRNQTSLKMTGWCTSAGNNSGAGATATSGDGYMNLISFAIVRITPNNDSAATIAGSSSAIRVLATATFATGASNDKTMSFSYTARQEMEEGDVLMPMMIAGYDENSGSGKTAYFNVTLEAEHRDG